MDAVICISIFLFFKPLTAERRNIIRKSTIPYTVHYLPRANDGTWESSLDVTGEITVQFESTKEQGDGKMLQDYSSWESSYETSIESEDAEVTSYFGEKQNSNGTHSYVEGVVDAAVRGDFA